MTDSILVAITDPATGRTFGGNLAQTATITDMRAPMSRGMSVKPDESSLFSVIAPSAPGFARIFSPPGAGLPNLNSKAIKTLPSGTLPWISHKDPVETYNLLACWTELQDRYRPPAGRRIRWTFQHEKAPATRDERLAWFDYWRNLVDFAADFPWIEPVQIQTDYAMRRRRDTNWRDWIIPGVSLGFDCYAARHGSGSPYEPVESAFAVLIAAAREYGCENWGVPELGADTVKGTPEERAGWLRQAGAYLDAQGAAFVGLWASHEVREGVTYDYRPNDEPTVTAFREFFAADL